MTSEERKEIRYRRRKEKRIESVKQLSKIYADPDKIFSTETIARGYKKCRKNSRWKASTQAYGANLFTNAARESRQLKSGSWKPSKRHEFDIIERGKPRHIQSVKIGEKSVQAAITNDCLIPILGKYLIFDNGACIPKHGTDLALDRFTEQLRWHYRRYGREGGILFYDFHEYFFHIPHKEMVHKVAEKVLNEDIMQTYKLIIEASRSDNKPEGLGLGSTVSQVSAVFYPNSIDHWLKDDCGIHGNGRYMDDGYIIHHDIEYLKQIAVELYARCEELNITMNTKKCRIIKLTNNFIFLKSRFFITESGKVVRRTGRHAITKERRRLRKMNELLTNKEKPFEEINIEFHSWLCSHCKDNSFYVLVNMIIYFNKLFSDYGGYTMPNHKPTKKQRNRYRIVKEAKKQAECMELNNLQQLCYNI